MNAFERACRKLVLSILLIALPIAAYFTIMARQDTTTTQELDTALIFQEDNNAYGYMLPPVSERGPVRDTMSEQTASQLSLFEDDVPLGPAHSVHADIRSSGMGRFSNWNTLLFSTTDNSDPRSNERLYRITYPMPPPTSLDLWNAAQFPAFVGILAVVAWNLTSAGLVMAQISSLSIRLAVSSILALVVAVLGAQSVPADPGWSSWGVNLTLAFLSTWVAVQSPTEPSRLPPVAAEVVDSTSQPDSNLTLSFLLTLALIGFYAVIFVFLDISLTARQQSNAPVAINFEYKVF
jgi:hypothetical protein